jgi:hypothetical protein
MNDRYHNSSVLLTNCVIVAENFLSVWFEIAQCFLNICVQYDEWMEAVVIIVHLETEKKRNNNEKSV